jgi:tripartite-type tricarboxylate transporter receptor subunit TctC
VASTILPHIEAGKLKALAFSSAKRAHVAPNVPTMIEAGLPDFEAGVWFGLVAPAGTPRAIIDKLSAAANDALAANEVAAKLRAQGFEPMGGPPDDFAQFIARETVKWTAAAEAAFTRRRPRRHALKADSGRRRRAGSARGQGAPTRRRRPDSCRR